MKYCVKCGAEMFDDAVLCVKCGALVEKSAVPSRGSQGTATRKSSLTTAAKVLMIIGTVIMALYTFCVALAWCLPMTISYCNRVKNSKPIGVGFKVCALLFVSFVGGVLMLCDKDE
ncbi:MAG: hypothetical protein E7585_05090 [Ruminococcaceae bacterium]|nr:hypothetical protein [Oscillospiraceae bacterium]